MRLLTMLPPLLALGLMSGPVWTKPVPEPWRNDGLCGAPLPHFAATDVEGCQDEAYCSSIDPETRVCACPDHGETPTDQVQLSVQYRGKVVKTWATDVMPVGLGPDSFRLDEFGWTPSGEKQTLLAVRHDQSNGMAVQSWSVWAIAQGQVSESMAADDYGLISFATRPQGRQGCQLLVSHWEQGPRAGLWAVGRWHQLQQGRFQPDPARPAVTRRYRFHFEHQRNESREANVPLRWYNTQDTRPLR